MKCGCGTAQRPVEPNKGDFLPDPIKPDKLDRIDLGKTRLQELANIRKRK